jgi:hypothetical protein
MWKKYIDMGKDIGVVQFIVQFLNYLMSCTPDIP